MSTITLPQNLQELDKYVRQLFIKHISETSPEFPRYTKSEAWPKAEGGLFEPFIRDMQTRSILPAPQKAENQPVVTQDLFPGRQKDVYSVRFGTALSFSYEKQKMGISKLNSAKRVAKYLADAIRMTNEAFYAALLDNCFDSTPATEFKCFDGLEGCNAAHVLLSGGTYSNLYGSAASPTYGVINDIATAFARVLNEDGYPMPTLRIRAWWIPPEEEACLLETLKSMGRPDTLVRADNILASREMVSSGTDGIQTLYYMSSNQWFAVDTSEQSLTRYELEAPRLETEYDRKTQAMTWQITEWIARAIWDWRGLYGVARA